MSDAKVTDGFADAVCIDAGRVYDSCMDRDCVEELRVYFNEAGQEAVQNAVNCRVKCAEVADVKIDVEPVAFNRGFFSCDLTFYLATTVEIQTSGCRCQEFTGVSAFSKRVILCGGDGAVKTFTSTTSVCGADGEHKISSNLPKCTVQCVDPVVLDSKICDTCRCRECKAMFPCNVLALAGGSINASGNRGLYITVGLFSIVQLVRNVQMLVPVYDFCVPKKECTEINDSPCDVFSRIAFPTDEFFPKADACRKDGCGCNTCDD